MSDNSYVLHCAWLIRCGQTVKANQRLTVVDGILQEVIDVPADERALIRPVALLPALVNAHTHLEFSNLPAPLTPPSPFPDWIRSVVKYRGTDLGEEQQIQNAVNSGVAESLRLGTSIVGEICTSDTARISLTDALAARGDQQFNKQNMEAICFRELLGFTANRIADQQAVAAAFVEAFRQSRLEGQIAKPAVTAGLSPHAPYSVHPEIVQYSCELAQRSKLPVAMHLAETRDEVQFIESQTGRFVEFLDGINLWQPESLQGINCLSDYLAMIRQVDHALAIHGNYWNQQDLQLLGDCPNITTVYCVRTHRWFGHSNHPWKQIESAGGKLILGTDSRASNPDLSIWKELQTFCQLHPDESLVDRLPMVSTHAASAIGLSAESVNLKVGQPFKATVVTTPAESESTLDQSLVKDSAMVQPLASIATMG
ncbi:MAG: amidohydrolase family protein [Fuerstiella sp.]